MHSIRKHLYTQMLLGMTVLLVLVNGLLFALLRTSMYRDLDETIKTRARALAMLTERDGGRVEFDFEGDAFAQFDDLADAEYFQLWLSNDQELARSRTLESGNLRMLPTDTDAFKTANITLPDGRPGRLGTLRFRPYADSEEDDDDEDVESPSSDPDDGEVVARIPEGDDEIRVSVAVARTGLTDTLRMLLLILSGATLAMIGGTACIIRRAVARGLAPLGHLNDRLERIDSNALQDRITLPQSPAELHRVLDTLNRLLERLEAAFQRERRFANDVVHELRTPVAELRTACEVGGKWPDDPQATSELFTDISEIALQMERTVENLLELTRSDNGQATLDQETVPLAALLNRCWRQCVESGDADSHALQNDVPEDLSILTDSGKLCMMLQNLLDNACVYSVPGTPVTCAAHTRPEGTVLTISNASEGLLAADLEHIFDRFWRRDEARTDARHSGLGLSIVRAIGELLGVRVGAFLRDGRIVEMRLQFPPG